MNVWAPQASDAAGADIRVSAAATQLLIGLVFEASDGRAVELLPLQASLTSYEAADLLNLPRHHLAKLLESEISP